MMKLPKSDVQDIALYLQTATAPRNVPPGRAVAGRGEVDRAGGRRFTRPIAPAAMARPGLAAPRSIPPLAGNGSVLAAAPTNVIGAVLNGVSPWNNGPAMPSFAAGLTDAEIAGVANYVRANWGGNGMADANPHDVAAARAVSVVPPMADAMSDAFGCPQVSATGGNAALTDPGSGLLDIYTGATPETLPNRTRMLVTALRTNDSTISAAALTDDLVAAYCPVVANTPGLSNAARMKVHARLHRQRAAAGDGAIRRRRRRRRAESCGSRFFKATRSGRTCLLWPDCGSRCSGNGRICTRAMRPMRRRISANTPHRRGPR